MKTVYFFTAATVLFSTAAFADLSTNELERVQKAMTILHIGF